MTPAEASLAFIAERRALGVLQRRLRAWGNGKDLRGDLTKAEKAWAEWRELAAGMLRREVDSQP